MLYIGKAFRDKTERIIYGTEWESIPRAGMAQYFRTEMGEIIFGTNRKIIPGPEMGEVFPGQKWESIREALCADVRVRLFANIDARSL